MRDETKFRVALLGIFTICMLGLALSALVPSCAQAQVATITLDWTSVPDDSLGVQVSAAYYNGVRSQVKPDTTGEAVWLSGGGLFSNLPAGLNTWWNQATAMTGLPVPKPGGQAESFTPAAPTATGWPAGTWYFQLRICDRTGNCSRSNIASKVVAQLADATPPGGVRDLRCRAEAVSP